MIIAYCDYAFDGVPSTDLLLLAASVRAFGGVHSTSPIRVYVEHGRRPTAAEARRADSLGVELRAYGTEPALAPWPFAMKAIAAAAAERDAVGQARTLLWLDRDSLVTGDLEPLELPTGKDLGYRPVNARNIGNPAVMGLDPFWSRVYELGGLGPSRAGTTTPYMDTEPLHFYMAAGLVAARPGRGILGAWAALERACAADKSVAALAAESQARRTFMHQAALSVAAASLAPKEARVEHGPDIMYPLNFWHSDQAARRPPAIEALRSLRYDAALEGDGWKAFPMGADFRSWLEANIKQREPSARCGAATCGLPPHGRSSIP